MYVFGLTSLLASVVIAFLGGHVFYRNPRGALNRVFALFCLLGGYTSFIEFGYRQAGSAAAAYSWMVAGVLWPFVLPLEVHFALLFTGRTKPLASRFTYLLLYAPALAFTILQLTSAAAIDPVKMDWGWTYTWYVNSAVDNLLGIWLIAMMSLTLYLCLRYYRETTEHTRRRQARYVFWGFSLSMAVTIVTELLPPYLGVRIPELTAAGFVVECLFIGYAMLRHGLFALTPATAAEGIISTMMDALFLVDTDGRIVTVNQAALDLLGYGEGELTGQPIEMFLEAGDGSGFQETHLSQLVAAGSLRDAEVVAKTRHAGRVPLSLSGSIMRDENSVEQGIVYVGRDLTERKRAEEQVRASLVEKDVLLQEVHHRVKNNLQVISSLLRLQSRRITDERALRAFKESRDQLRSIALVHERLYQSPDLTEIDFAKYLHDLITHLFDSHRARSGAVTLKVDVADVALGLDTAVPCGLIINELVSNALKYAFPDGYRVGDNDKEVCVVLRQEGEDQVALTVSDNGIGFPPGADLRDARSLGLPLVSTLVRQLGGSIEFDGSQGTTFKIVFPLT